jgi:cell division protein FtsB
MLAEALEAEFINKAVGGAVFNPALAKIPCDTQADYIIVAYGTNDWNSVDLETLEAEQENLRADLETLEAENAALRRKLEALKEQATGGNA